MKGFWPVRLGSIAIALLAVFAVESAFSTSNFTQRLVVLAALYVTLAVSLNLINGITGQFSMGHAAFYMVGAYTAGFVTIFNQDLARQYPLPWLFLMMVLGAIGAAIAGIIVGVPSLRLRGDYLAIVTLGFGEIVRIVAQNLKFERNGTDIGGSIGISDIPEVNSPGVAWLLAIIAIALCRNLLRTGRGLAFLAVREDEVASLAMGVNVTRIKVTAFLLGSALAGAAGAILAHYEGYISPQMFSMDTSFIIVTMVVLGGTGSITGSVVAALLLFYLPERMRELGNMPIGGVAGFFIGLFVAVALVRMVGMRYHEDWLGMAKRYALAVLGGVAVALVIGYGLQAIPAVASQPLVEGTKLRMVVFAVTLIVLMLLRPQGIFGHKEFSWDWVRRFLGKRAEATAS